MPKIDAKKAKKTKKKSSGPKARAKKAAKSGSARARAKSTGGCPKQALNNYADKYAEVVNDSVPWRWDDIGTGLSKSDRKKIRALARKKNLVPVIPVDHNQYPDFGSFVKEDNTNLPQELHQSTDAKQFKWLNDDLKKREPTYDPDTQSFPPDPKKYTWHHHQDTGRMQLVEFGVHNATNHKGGRTTWAQGKR